MPKPPIPANETERLQALRALNVLDTPPEERFDRLTRIAQHILQVPIALVSLVDAERQWFKSRQGLDACETPRDISFCGYAILQPEVFVVTDPVGDPRFADNPLVTGEPKIRFYAGAPLTLSNGLRVGTLCAIDHQPHLVTAEQLAALRDLAQCVSEELEVWRRRLIADDDSLTQAKYAAIVASSDDAILSKTLDGIITSWNPAAETLFGYTAQQAIGNPMAMLIPPERIDEERRFLDSIALGERIEHFETVRIRKDGHRLDVSASISPIFDDSGKVVAASTIVRDITERKRAERMKDELVSTVSHELRTPLTSIRGALGLVIGRFSSTLPARALQLLETANRNSERLTLLIDDILDLEKLQSGKLEFEYKTLDLTAVANQAIAANEGYGQQHGVHLQLTGAPKNALVRADEHRLLQVFANLISNAVKYSPAGSTVEVSVCGGDGRFQVRVQDFGRGIPAEFHARIFQRFAQADSSDTRLKGGTGLGLSITKAIVEQQGGRIGFTSEEGVGTVFYFDLPEWREVIEQAPKEDRPHMLICEDDPDAAMVIAEILEHEGITSDRVLTATAAQQLISRKHYNALLLDLCLPDVDGLTLIERLRDDPASRDLPIIVVSGRPREGKNVWQGAALSVLDWLRKPVDRDRLARALQSALRHTKRRRILHVEDDLDIIHVTQALVEKMADYTSATSLAAARHHLAQTHWDLVLLDLKLPDGSGFELLDAIGVGTKVIVFSGQDTVAVIEQHAAAGLTKATTGNERLLAVIRQHINN